jgi:hypothetical protein
MSRPHTHRAVPKLCRTFGWSACVGRKDGGYCNGASHGGVTHLDVCRCGAKRRTESNGNRRTIGPWEEPEPK